MQLLPAEEAFRKTVAFTPPERYLKLQAGNDTVTFHAERAKGKGAAPLVDDMGQEITEVPSHKQQACYSSLRPNYTGYNITCYPRHQSPVSLEEASEFFQIMLAAHIIPAEARLFWVSSKAYTGVHCQIPASLPGPELVYAALTCYRWINARPALVWEVLALHKLGLGISVFQILPYVINKYISNYNHSFIISRPLNEGTYVGIGGCSLNPMVGVAAHRYFNPRLKRPRIKGYVNDTIRELAESITPVGEKPPAPAANPWVTTYDKMKFQLERPEDGLHPRFLALYEDPEPSKNRAEKILNQLCHKEK